MPVSISVYCDIHKFPCYAISSCHVARLGREVAAMDGKSYQDARNEQDMSGYVRIAQPFSAILTIF